MKKIALIPARFGSKRIPGKNIASLNGHPLIAYSILSAIASGVFDKIYVSTESEEIASIAKKYGASVDFLRPAEYSQDHSVDFDWILFTLNEFKKRGEDYNIFSILRPTSPLRTKETIQRAWQTFEKNLKNAHSLRAVQKVSEHPGKMWKIEGEFMEPLWKAPNNEQPFHSRPYQSLPETYIQNASLEIAWSSVVFDYKNISGTKVVPFLTQSFEGYDLNTADDLDYLNYLLLKKVVSLPPLT